MSAMDNILQYRGQDLVDNDGGKVGKVEEIYLDTETNAPEWALVNTGMFGTKSTFVPIRDASESGGSLRVPFDKAMIKDAPNVDAEGELSQQEEADLYRYYGMDYSEASSDSGLPEGGAGTTGYTDVDRTTETRGVVGNDTSGPETDSAMTRSEEELRIGKAQRETGRVRLRKYITTENVQQTVPLQREEIRIEREPITDANRDAALSGGDLTEEEHEVTLHEEEVVADKRVVPKERVRLDKDVVTEDVQVNESVRKEQIEMEGAEGTTRGRTDADRLDADRLPGDSPLDRDRR